MPVSKPNLYLIFHGRFPSEKAASLFAAKSCEAFANERLNVTLLVPRRTDRESQEYSAYYGIRNNFRVVFLPTIDLFRIPFLKRISFAVSFVSFSLFSFVYLIFKAKNGDIIYSNETLPLLLTSFISSNTIYEMHDFPENRYRFYNILFKKVRAIISTNRWKKNMLVQKFNISPDKILYEPNAVQIENFLIEKPQKETRDELNLPQDKTLIGYLGMFRTMDMSKGIDTALEALGKLGESFQLVLVGGSKEEIEYYKNKAKEVGVLERVIFTGWIPNHLVPKYLAACDILIAPFPGSQHYNFFMSPMKIFEYMASKRPIIATDLVAIREILDNNQSALLVAPEDATALSTAIQKLKNEPSLADQLTDKAFEKVKNHTWGKRARRILDFIKTKI